jgi:uncharacterized membrane protein
MNIYLRRLRGVTAISLIWGLVWATMFTALTFVLQRFLPFDSDIGTIRLMLIIGWVGLVSGGLFGILLAIIESGKIIRSLSVGRVMVWGILSSAVYPLVTGRANQVFWTCTFGAVVAVVLVVLAQKASLRDLSRPRSVVATFLACMLVPVRDTIGPMRQSAP